MKNISPMRNGNKLMIAFALIGLIGLGSCKSQGGKDLSPVTQSRNMYQNATAMTSGFLVLGFDQAFQEALQTKIDTAAKTVAPMEEILKLVPAKALSDLGSINKKFDSVFTAIKKDHPKVYQKMFTSEKAKEALKISDNAQLPDGFKPLTQNLSKEDMEKYLVYVISNGKAKGREYSDEVVSYVKRCLKWQKELTKSFENDPDIAAVMKEK